jgi:hypothetical protein
MFLRTRKNQAVCDVSLNGEDAAPLAKIIWKVLKKELG